MSLVLLRCVSASTANRLHFPVVGGSFPITGTRQNLIKKGRLRKPTIFQSMGYHHWWEQTHCSLFERQRTARGLRWFFNSPSRGSPFRLILFQSETPSLIEIDEENHLEPWPYQISCKTKNCRLTQLFLGSHLWTCDFAVGRIGFTSSLVVGSVLAQGAEIIPSEILLNFRDSLVGSASI